MEIGAVDSGMQTIQHAFAKLDAAAKNIASGDWDVQDVVDIRYAEFEAKVGARVIRASDRMFDALIDVLG
ncbi:MAG TPA: hypothetical protein VKE69_10450 [Planctomycetota bacterium]|nr:hypothetical protein [Planctomycetota bacterium]